MSKGYADYLCVLARELDRDIQRENDGVEVPMFSNEFEEWLKTEASEKSRGNYKRWLHKADAWICESDRDFWTLLKKAWDASDFDTAKTLCARYEGLLLDERVKAEKEGKEEFGESASEISNWIRAFRKYIKFHEEQIKKASADKKALAAMIEASRETSDRLFLGARFIHWGVEQGHKQKTIESYVSNIKLVNHEFFCKTGYDVLHDFLPDYVKAKNMVEIDKMFAAMDCKLNERIDSYNETEMSRKAFINARSALRMYAEFIKSLNN